MGLLCLRDPSSARSRAGDASVALESAGAPTPARRARRRRQVRLPPRQKRPFVPQAAAASLVRETVRFASAAKVGVLAAAYGCPELAFRDRLNEPFRNPGGLALRAGASSLPWSTWVGACPLV